MLGLGVFKERCFILLLVCSTIAGFGFFVPFSYLNAHAGANGISYTNAALLNAIIGITNCVTRPIYGIIVSYKVLSGVTLMNWSLIVFGSFTIAVPFFTKFWSLSIYAVLIGLAVAAYGCANILAVAELVGLNHLTNALGYCYLLAGIAAIAGPPLLGLFTLNGSDTYLWIFIISGILLLLGGLLGLPLHKVAELDQERKQKAEEKKANKTFDVPTVHLPRIAIESLDGTTTTDKTNKTND